MIIGFLGTSQINKKTKRLTATKPNELFAITKVVVDKSKYKQLIRKSRTLSSYKILSLLQLSEIKELSKTTANVNKSRNFRR